jgi:hypothetical protein
MSAILTAVAVIAYLLHQDLWFWNTPYPLVFGFIPVGLFYHGCYSLLASLYMLLLVKTAWPEQLEEN